MEWRVNVGLEVLQESEIRLHWWSEMFFFEGVEKGFTPAGKDLIVAILDPRRKCVTSREMIAMFKKTRERVWWKGRGIGLGCLGFWLGLVVCSGRELKPGKVELKESGKGAIVSEVTVERLSRLDATASFNDLVLEAVETMPVGGGYAASRAANEGLAKAIGLDREGGFVVDAKVAQPSYCSGATYLVLLRALSGEIGKIQNLEARKALIQCLKMRAQPDGVGVWGRWNSNGPCMAVWFNETKMGFSFEDSKLARGGDFLKLWWKEPIGKDEAGHSVVYLGKGVTSDGEVGFEIWSSNKPLGYGKKVVPLSKVKRALFSRCDHPERVSEVTLLPERSGFLSEMLKRNMSQEEWVAVLAGKSMSVGKKPAN